MNACMRCQAAAAYGPRGTTRVGLPPWMTWCSKRNARVRAATERGGDDAAYGMKFRLASPQLPSVLRKRNIAYCRFVDVEDTRPRNHVLGHGVHQAGPQQLGDNFLLFV